MATSIQTIIFGEIPIITMIIIVANQTTPLEMFDEAAEMVLLLYVVLVMVLLLSGVRTAAA